MPIIQWEVGKNAQAFDYIVNIITGYVFKGNYAYLITQMSANYCIVKRNFCPIVGIWIN